MQFHHELPAITIRPLTSDLRAMGPEEYVWEPPNQELLLKFLPRGCKLPPLPPKVQDKQDSLRVHSGEPMGLLDFLTEQK